jgi:hypothetical protein
MFTTVTPAAAACLSGLRGAALRLGFFGAALRLGFFGVRSFALFLAMKVISRCKREDYALGEIA